VSTSAFIENFRGGSGEGVAVGLCVSGDGVETGLACGFGEGVEAGLVWATWAPNGRAIANPVKNNKNFKVFPLMGMKSSCYKIETCHKNETKPHTGTSFTTTPSPPECIYSTSLPKYRRQNLSFLKK
jgi:hypothetical protein